MPEHLDPRRASAANARSRTLGPYEAAYDTRRGYTEPPRPAEAHVRHDDDEVWRGRGRDER